MLPNTQCKRFFTFFFAKFLFEIVQIFESTENFRFISTFFLFNIEITVTQKYKYSYRKVRSCIFNGTDDTESNAHSSEDAAVTHTLSFTHHLTIIASKPVRLFANNMLKSVKQAHDDSYFVQFATCCMVLTLNVTFNVLLILFSKLLFPCHGVIRNGSIRKHTKKPFNILSLLFSIR